MYVLASHVSLTLLFMSDINVFVNLCPNKIWLKRLVGEKNPALCLSQAIFTSLTLITQKRLIFSSYQWSVVSRFCLPILILDAWPWEKISFKFQVFKSCSSGHVIRNIEFYFQKLFHQSSLNCQWQHCALLYDDWNETKNLLIGTEIASLIFAIFTLFTFNSPVTR